MSHFQRYALRGFSLAEVLIAIVIITILTIGSIAVYSSQIAKARDTERMNDVSRIKLQLDTIVGMYGQPPRNEAKARKMPLKCAKDLNNGEPDLFGCFMELRLSSKEDLYNLFVDPSEGVNIPGTTDPFRYKYAANENSYIVCATLEDQKSNYINANKNGVIGTTFTGTDNMYCEKYTAPGSEKDTMPEAKRMKVPDITVLTS